MGNVLKKASIYCLIGTFVFVMGGFNLAISPASASTDIANKTMIYKSNKIKQPASFVEGEVLVKFKEDKLNLNTSQGIKELSALSERKDVREKDIVKQPNIALLESNSKTTQQLIDELENDPTVEYVEPNYIRQYASIPNDADFNKLWGLNNTGQSINGVTGTNDADIDAPEAWDIFTNSNEVTVAVIDSGVTPDHPDLSSRLVAGWNFVDNDSTTDDIVGHGTHVAGIIAAEGNNSLGIAGVNWNTKIMPLKVGNLEGVTSARFISALDYAVSNGIKIVNYSVGGYDYSSLEYWAISDAEDQDVLLIAAAGNESNNNDTLSFYPAGYNLDNIISVAATDQDDNLASFSNYGINSVDVAAPGKNIYSTYPNFSEAISENFEEVTTPNVPDGWLKTDNWGTYNLGGSLGNVLYGDYSHIPYVNNANSTLTSPTIDLDNTLGAKITFLTACDTDY